MFTRFPQDRQRVRGVQNAPTPLFGNRTERWLTSNANAVGVTFHTAYPDMHLLFLGEFHLAKDFDTAKVRIRDVLKGA